MTISDNHIKKLNKILEILNKEDDSDIIEINIRETQTIIKHIQNYAGYIDNPEKLTKYSDNYASYAQKTFTTLKQKLDLISFEIITTPAQFEERENTQKTIIIYNNNRHTPFEKKISFSDINTEFKRLELLSVIKDENKNVVLLGANGSGKSSFANFLKQAKSENICVIPAQKILYFGTKGQYQHNTTSSDINNKQANNTTKGELNTYDLSSYFSNLITALINEDTQLLADKDDGLLDKDKYMMKSSYTRLKKIFESIIPNITLSRDTSNRTLVPKNNSSTYNLNNMSDGEKAIIFYIADVLLASKNSFIIVDEPETYINPTIYKKLWDILISERGDCQFIFITHSMDFIASRDSNTTSFYWIREFTPPEDWQLDPLPNIENLPQTLVAELAGSRKPILFCEGTYDSYDYEIYSILFSNKYAIQPVGGHTTVISYTRAFNNSSQYHHNRAIGIIDGDLISNKKITKYKEDQIFVLPFNEIEMILLLEPIIDAVLKPFNESEKVTEKIEEFKKALQNKLSENKERILTSAIKKEIDQELENYRIQSFNTIENIKNEVDTLSNKITDIEKLEKKHTENLNKALAQKDYLKMLKLCNLKNEVLNGLGNKIDNNYADKAKAAFKKSLEIQQKIIDDYFSDI